jgi:hypothetical protein
MRRPAFALLLALASAPAFDRTAARLTPVRHSHS